MPREIIKSERSWAYVLLHGDDELVTGWDPTWLDQDQAKKLFTFLGSEIRDPSAYDLVRRLQGRLETGNSD